MKQAASCTFRTILVLPILLNAPLVYIKLGGCPGMRLRGCLSRWRVGHTDKRFRVRSRAAATFSFYFLFPTFSLHPYLLIFWQRLIGRPFLDPSVEWGFTSFYCFHPFRALFDPPVATTVGGSSPGLGPGRHPQGGGGGRSDLMIPMIIMIL